MASKRCEETAYWTSPPAEQVQQEWQQLWGGGRGEVLERPGMAAENDTDQRGRKHFGMQSGVRVGLSGQAFTKWGDRALVEFRERGCLGLGIVIGPNTGLQDRAGPPPPGPVQQPGQPIGIQQVGEGLGGFLGMQDLDEQLRLPTEVRRSSRHRRRRVHPMSRAVV